MKDKFGKMAVLLTTLLLTSLAISNSSVVAGPVSETFDTAGGSLDIQAATTLSGGSSAFTWVTLAGINTWGGLAWDQGNYIYEYIEEGDVEGLGTVSWAIVRYSIADDSWELVANTPFSFSYDTPTRASYGGETIWWADRSAFEDGSGISWYYPSDDSIGHSYPPEHYSYNGIAYADGYTYVGGKLWWGNPLPEHNFWRYSAATGWEPLADHPTGNWTDIEWTGGDYLYTIESDQGIYRYSISSNQWEHITTSPYPIISMTWDWNNKFYALEKATWPAEHAYVISYSILDGAWQVEDVTPGPINEAADIVFADDALYVGSGDGNFWRASAISKPSVVINEVYVNAVNEGRSEWVELYNAGTADVDISGWRIYTKAYSPDAGFPEGTVIPAGGYFVIGDADWEPDDPTWATPDRLENIVFTNIHGWVELRDGDGNPLDTVGWGKRAEKYEGEPYPKRYLPEGKSLVRPVAGLDTDNNAVDLVLDQAPSLGPTKVLINEVYANAVDESNSEWIELYNPHSFDVDISGWLIDTKAYDADATLPEGAVISAGGFYVIGDKGWAPDNAEWQADYTGEEITITNRYGSVRLRGSAGNVVDALGWGSKKPERVKYYEGTPFKRSGMPEGASVMRKRLGLDTNSNYDDFKLNWEPATGI